MCFLFQLICVNLNAWVIRMCISTIQAEGNIKSHSDCINDLLTQRGKGSGYHASHLHKVDHVHLVSVRGQRAIQREARERNS